MLVKVIGSWFGPDNKLRKTGVHSDVDPDWKLPSNAEVLEEDEPVVKKPAAK